MAWNRNTANDHTSARLGCLLLGGKHHLYHLAPAAAKIAASRAIDVDLLVTSREEAELARDVLNRLGGQRTRVEILDIPSPLKAVMARPKLKPARKIALLVANRSKLCAYDALLVVERTSTLLKRLPGKKPYLIHIPHGAGDRARGFERRIRRFDHVIVAGAKDKRRMREMQLVEDGNCTVSGYLKTGALRAISPSPVRIFDNDKPVVLYNPHFDPAFSSWENFAEVLIMAFRLQSRLNLIVAPHCRMFSQAGSDRRREIEALAVPGSIIVDLGSDRSDDMTYTRAADIYVGDVSSQVYEFLAEGPKPCVFLGRERIEWRRDPDYAHWHFGEVCFSPQSAMTFIERAHEAHPYHAPRQVSGIADALGGPGHDPLAAAATIISDLITKVRIEKQARNAGRQSWRKVTSNPNFIGEMP